MKTSHLDFKLIDPVEAGEELAVEFGSPYHVVEIYIDGVELCDIVRPLEKACIKKGTFDFSYYKRHKQHYGHMRPGELYGNLIRAVKYSDPDYEDDNCLLLCCAQCGMSECWSISIQVEENEEYIFWYDFHHLVEDWEYGLTYKFEKKQYESTMRKLRRFIRQQKR